MRQSVATLAWVVVAVCADMGWHHQAGHVLILDIMPYSCVILWLVARVFPVHKPSCVCLSILSWTQEDRQRHPAAPRLLGAPDVVAPCAERLLTADAALASVHQVAEKLPACGSTDRGWASRSTLRASLIAGDYQRARWPSQICMLRSQLWPCSDVCLGA